MTNLVLERMTEISRMANSPMRACEHVPAAHDSGGNYGMCGQHLVIGLFCEPCGLGHASAMHALFKCDYCGAEDLPDDAFGVPALGAFDAIVLDVPGWPRADPPVLMMARFPVFGTPLVCEREPCMAAAVRDLEETAEALRHGELT